MSDFLKRHQELLDKKTNLFKCDDCLVKDEQIKNLEEDRKLHTALIDVKIERLKKIDEYIDKRIEYIGVGVVSPHAIRLELIRLKGKIKELGIS